MLGKGARLERRAASALQEIERHVEADAAHAEDRHLAPGARALPAMMSLLTTMMHTGALGALMTFSRASWYAGFGLEDQQLAGLVMWVPAGLAYPLAALFLLSRALRARPS